MKRCLGDRYYVWLLCGTSGASVARRAVLGIGVGVDQRAARVTEEDRLRAGVIEDTAGLPPVAAIGAIGPLPREERDLSIDGQAEGAESVNVTVGVPHRPACHRQRGLRAIDDRDRLVVRI